MTMSLHKLTAGSGYDYLTRQVAAMDTTSLGSTSLATYYSEKGEVPGRWVGGGLAGIEGLSVGDVVTGEQMESLFAFGLHPLANQRFAALGEDASSVQIREARQLGNPYRVYAGGGTDFQIEVARRIERWNAAEGLPRGARRSTEDRARVTSQVAREFFAREHGREPADARELSSAVAKLSRPGPSAVAGFDLTFSPVKSVSTLWAVADPSIGARIELAHNAAVAEALEFIESAALFTRCGTDGVRQVDVRGLVGVSFTHRDSRAGDPDLHTHVAIANKVQTLDSGRWLAIDGRVLYKAAVSASEVYNTALERHLAASLGVVFAERRNPDVRKRPVREIVGVDSRLTELWSSRRADIEVRRAELARAFQAEHGRPPTAVEAIDLAQTATLQTRAAKHEPRSLAEQRDTWARDAGGVLGGPAGIARMVVRCLSPIRHDLPPVEPAWIDRTASTIVATIQEHRSTWQVWHLTAEAQRQVRKIDLPPVQVADVVSRLVDTAKELSQPTALDLDPISDPAGLRRRDGSSVYTVAGAALFTSEAIESAEHRVWAAGGQTGGRIVGDGDVRLGLLECTLHGTDLNAGQASMVRQMATSGARVQVGLAAAGTGKTTAMSALTRIWELSGGNVVGLAPSAAAAAELREQTGSRTDTIAKLVHELRVGDHSTIAGRIDADTLVLIDEVGMAGTLNLDRVVAFALERGASVRMIGDTQQLAAVESGGVVRDLVETYGAAELTELMRFNDPAEAAATLALREGQPDALGFYLDNRRVHVGDLATLTDEVFSAWLTDRTAGRDSIMLAPTRDLVADLNARARTARLAALPDGGKSLTIRLADGNHASVGDVVITRENTRRLRISATDWVKNGDRWTVTDVTGGRLVVAHNASGLSVTLPADYVSANTELGYACTVHTAQGISVDTMHGLVTGEEPRQQFYTMMTRGRDANHAYVVAAPDGDPHAIIDPEVMHPDTATEVLEQVLARDGAPRSATTIAREAANPARQLAAAVARYTDAVHFAAETFAGPARVGFIETQAEALVPAISDEPAWRVLRAHLLLREAHGRDAIDDLADAVAARNLDGVLDRAALLDWRLDPTGMRGADTGPLPWLPAIPATLLEQPDWGDYLRNRAARIDQLVTTVREDAADATPSWARHAARRLDPDLAADVAVWRASFGVDPDDRRATGEPQRQHIAADHQRALDERLNTGHQPALAEWGPLLDAICPRRDTYTTLLAERLAAVSRAGIDAAALLRRASGEGPLPDDHVAAALWWRIARHLSPAVAVEAGHGGHVDTDWTPLLTDLLGTDHATGITDSPAWPTLVSVVEHALERGWQLHDLLNLTTTADLDDVDPAQALIWRIAIVTEPTPDQPEPDYNPPPADLDDLATAREQAELSPDAALARAARTRNLMDPLEPTDAHIGTLLDRAWEMKTATVPPDRVMQILEATARFYESRLPWSWAHDHLQLRLGQDITGDPRFRPGHAPAGWTTLITHLHAQGVTDQEMIAAGVAKTAANGHLIDRMRDRLVLPVIADERVLGFVGRRNPDAEGDYVGPKYLNTPDTIVFHKGAQLYGISDDHVTTGSIPVIVEGPIDALAVTLATGGAYLGVAPLGTALTEEQAAQLGRLGTNPIVATDGDLAGRLAAERDYWLLTPHQFDPTYVRFSTGDDPAGLLERGGPVPLVRALQHAAPLASALIEERATNIGEPTRLINELASVVAAQPPEEWRPSIENLESALALPDGSLLRATAQQADVVNRDRRRFAEGQLVQISNVRARLETSTAAASPGEPSRPQKGSGFEEDAPKPSPVPEGHEVRGVADQSTTRRR